MRIAFRFLDTETINRPRISLTDPSNTSSETKSKTRKSAHRPPIAEFVYGCTSEVKDFTMAPCYAADKWRTRESSVSSYSSMSSFRQIHRLDRDSQQTWILLRGEYHQISHPISVLRRPVDAIYGTWDEKRTITSPMLGEVTSARTDGCQSRTTSKYVRSISRCISSFEIATYFMHAVQT